MKLRFPILTRPLCTVSAIAAVLLATNCALATSAQDGSRSVDPNAHETKQHRDARMRWWREARFGMFIHWGLYSVPAGVYGSVPTNGAGEWIMHDLQIPVDVYAAYARQFDPEKFNAAQWVSFAKAAGMKYIVMTAKHHEGFAMYPTKVDDWSLAGRTVFKRDPIGEMSAACKKAGLKFGVYYSQNLDWHHPGGGTAGPAWDEKQKGSFDEYLRKISAPQVRELLTTYKPAVLWWDINADLTPEEVRLFTSSFASDPGLIANNRLGGGVPGDTETPEQRIPATGFKGRDWETCMTINDTWGYKSTDLDFKSTETLLHNLIDIASKGGNYLLNVGPTSEGIIPEAETLRLKEMGDWMKQNGESIYGTTASPFKKLPFDGRATVKGRSLFLNVFQWPSGGLVLPGLTTPIQSARCVDGGQKLQVTRRADGTYQIERPAKLDPYSTAIQLVLKGSPQVAQQDDSIRRSGDAYILLPDDAEVTGGLQVEKAETPNLGYWTDASDTASWTIKTAATEAGRYKVALEYSCEPGSGGAHFGVKVDGRETGVTGTIEQTKGWSDYQLLKLDGAVELATGNHTIQIYATSNPGVGVMNLRSLTLTSAG